MSVCPEGVRDQVSFDRVRLAVEITRQDWQIVLGGQKLATAVCLMQYSVEYSYQLIDMERRSMTSCVKLITCLSRSDIDST